MAKFATGIRPPRVVDTLPVTPFVGYENGDTVVLTTDSKLYRFNGTGFTKAVDGLDIIANTVTTGAIKAGAIEMAKFASGIRPPRVVTTLPTSPFTGYVKGDTVVLTTDSKLYRFNGTVFYEGGGRSRYRC